MAEQPRLSQQGLRVLRVFLEKPSQSHSGADLGRLAGVGSGTLYPLLMRLEEAAWLVSEWEICDPSEVGRPRKRFYKLTGLGQSRAAAAIDELRLPEGRLAWNS
jgi:PadR family transcriptional regulator, regulatory protein PadR